MECPNCKHTEFSNNGISTNNRQRYKCKNCKKEYPSQRNSYTKTEKRLLSMLINFLEKDFEGNDLKKLLENSKEYKSGISNIELQVYKEIKPYGYRTEYKVPCKKPRLLICEDKNKIKIIKLPSRIVPSKAKSFNFILG